MKEYAKDKHTQKTTGGDLSALPTGNRCADIQAGVSSGNPAFMAPLKSML